MRPFATTLLAFLLLALASCVSPKPVEMVKHAPWPTASPVPGPTAARTSIAQSWRPTPATVRPRPTATATPTPTITPTVIPPMPPPTEPITAENIARLAPYARFGGRGRVFWLSGGQRLGWSEGDRLQIYTAPDFASGKAVVRLKLQGSMRDVAGSGEYGDLALLSTFGENQLVENLTVWDLARDQEVVTIPGKGSEYYLAVLSPSGQYIARSGMGFAPPHPAAIEVFDLNGNLVQTFDDEDCWPARLAFSPDGTRLAVSSESKTAGYKVWVWDVITGELLEVIDLSGIDSEFQVVFNPVEDQLVVMSSDPSEILNNLTIRIWDFTMGGWTGEEWSSDLSLEYTSWLRVSPGGDMIYYNASDESYLYASRNNKQLPLPSFAWEVQDVLFSPDGLYAAVRYEHETILYIVGQ